MPIGYCAIGLSRSWRTVKLIDFATIPVSVPLTIDNDYVTGVLCIEEITMRTILVLFIAAAFIAFPNFMLLFLHLAF